MGFSLQHHSLNFAVVVLGEAVLLLHLAALLLQDAPAGALRFGLERVKHGGADQQVREHAENERQGPHVLLLHPRRRHESRRQIGTVTGDTAPQRRLHIGVGACCVKRSGGRSLRGNQTWGNTLQDSDLFFYNKETHTLLRALTEIDALNTGICLSKWHQRVFACAKQSPIKSSV